MYKLLALLVLQLPFHMYAQCNGYTELCGKKYNEVAYLTTHNAYNAGDDGFNLPNQTFGLTRQLQDGVRAVMLDVYDEGGVATVYHGFSFMGTATLASNLNEIKSFLTANPNEVVTLLFETYISSSLMESELQSAGLMPMLHVQPLGQPWPTLQEMIEENKRVVVFSEQNNGTPAQGWYHYLWDYAVETHFTNHTITDFSCAYNRGNPNNDLFIVNHFITDATLSTGQLNQAEVINQFDFFYNRMQECQIEHQKFPNFPTVDFYEVGTTATVVDSLNQVAAVSSGIYNRKTNSWLVTSNPSAGRFIFRPTTPWLKSKYVVTNMLGEIISTGRLQASTTIDLTLHPAGVYTFSAQKDEHGRVQRLVKQ